MNFYEFMDAADILVDRYDWFFLIFVIVIIPLVVIALQEKRMTEEQKIAEFAKFLVNKLPSITTCLVMSQQLEKYIKFYERKLEELAKTNEDHEFDHIIASNFSEKDFENGK